MSSGPVCKSLLCDVIGLLITTLQLAQFIPQHVEMVVDRSVLGLSPWLLFFNSLYTYLAAVDIMVLNPLPIPSSFSPGALYRAFIAAQPHIQMIGSAVLSATMWFWYLRFFQPDDHAAHFRHQRRRVSECRAAPLIRVLLLPDVSPRVVFATFVAIAVAIATIAVLLVRIAGAHAPSATAFAHMCGISAAPLNALMWAPQIALTAAFGHRGALSPAWVLASFLMDVAYSAYLIVLGLHWSVWINNVPDAILTAALLLLILRFTARDRAQGLDEFGRPRQHWETTPLVSAPAFSQGTTNPDSHAFV